MDSVTTLQFTVCLFLEYNNVWSGITFSEPRSVSFFSDSLQQDEYKKLVKNPMDLKSLH